MKLKIFACVGVFSSFLGCSKPEMTISVLAEQGKEGSYTLKWEVFPEQDDALVEIYASDNDTIFPSTPIQVVNVDNFIAEVKEADSLNYSYFKLKVRDTYSQVIKNRFYHFDDIQNFRDIGGYKTSDYKTVKWGKVFRSGDFHRISNSDQKILNRLNLHTIVDFRSVKGRTRRPDRLTLGTKYDLSVLGATSDSIADRVFKDSFFKGDAIIYMQDTYKQIVLGHTQEYAKFYDLLLDEGNYPIVYHCGLGKDQSGVATYFLLRALGVPVETIEDDYMYSNYGIDKTKLIRLLDGIFDMSESQQEAFTMLTRTDVSYLRYALACVKKEHGSVDEFMVQQLGLTKEKRERLRQILLY